MTLSPSGASSIAPSADTGAGPGPGQMDVCSFFTEADAESIMGAPMRRSKITNPQRNCIYEEVKARPNSLGPGTVSLTLNQRKSVDDENRDWAEIKEVRHLQQGQKNVQSLQAIGDEAWFTGNTEKGKVGVAAVIARKGKSDFMLDSMVLEYVASPGAMKSFAQKLANRLE